MSSNANKFVALALASAATLALTHGAQARSGETGSSDNCGCGPTSPPPPPGTTNQGGQGGNSWAQGGQGGEGGQGGNGTGIGYASAGAAAGASSDANQYSNQAQNQRTNQATNVTTGATTTNVKTGANTANGGEGGSATNNNSDVASSTGNTGNATNINYTTRVAASQAAAVNPTDIAPGELDACTDYSGRALPGGSFSLIAFGASLNAGGSVQATPDKNCDDNRRITTVAAATVSADTTNCEQKNVAEAVGLGVNNIPAAMLPGLIASCSPPAPTVMYIPAPHVVPAHISTPRRPHTVTTSCVVDTVCGVETKDGSALIAGGKLYVAASKPASVPAPK